MRLLGEYSFIPRFSCVDEAWGKSLGNEAIIMDY